MTSVNEDRLGAIPKNTNTTDRNPHRHHGAVLLKCPVTGGGGSPLDTKSIDNLGCYAAEFASCYESVRIGFCDRADMYGVAQGLLSVEPPAPALGNGRV